ncbi:sodium-dependent neutral amino acid transporter B(0)AT3-like [Physella acuta]|uniref:sodium-dependent neutral amino acid transporter B(0)AT3-like n=1 Tax=Physella acuta TaxID=109671 RepID=UPI0027DCF3AE|nr:sodium-dependent neutral amino acid transporter B(0)AT3-like [Physella acuta]
MSDSGDLNPNPSKWSLLQISAICAFSSLGYCGFTSLPFYVYAHTGLFFFAYYTLLVLVCVPVCYVQIKLGALYKRGLIGIFTHLVPILKGVAAGAADHDVLPVHYPRSGNQLWRLLHVCLVSAALPLGDTGGG